MNIMPCLIDKNILTRYERIGGFIFIQINLGIRDDRIDFRID